MVNAKAPIFLIVDGHPIHRAKSVKGFVEAQNGLVVGPSPLGNLVPVHFEKANVADQTETGNVGVAGGHDVSGQNARFGLLHLHGVVGETRTHEAV